MSNDGRGLFFFLSGILAGAVAGVLLAPKSGKETRNDIQDYMNDAEEKYSEKKDEIKNATSKHLSKIKEQVAKTFEEGKKRIEQHRTKKTD